MTEEIRRERESERDFSKLIDPDYFVNLYHANWQLKRKKKPKCCYTTKNKFKC